MSKQRRVRTGLLWNSWLGYLFILIKYMMISYINWNKWNNAKYVGLLYKGYFNYTQILSCLIFYRAFFYKLQVFQNIASKIIKRINFVR